MFLYISLTVHGWEIILLYAVKNNHFFMQNLLQKEATMKHMREHILPNDFLAEKILLSRSFLIK